MGNAPLLWIGVIAGVAGVAVLRLAWGRQSRSWPLNAGGWALLAGGSLAAGFAEGAWGVSIMALAAMAGASVALLSQAARAPAAKARASARRVRMLPEAGEPPRLAGRLLTFAITVLGGLAISLALGTASRGLGVMLGWGEANANTLAFIVVPFAWAILVTVILMQQRRRSQLLTLLVAGVAALPAIGPFVLA